MKPATDNPNMGNSNIGVAVFDEVARLDADASLTTEEAREVAGLLGRLTTPAETTAVCGRVRSRLFVPQPGGLVRGFGRGLLVAPRWLAAAAAFALLVTGLAVFRVLPTRTQPVPEVVVSAGSEVTTLIFPDEAVMDARLACLEADLTAIADESFWSLDDDLPQRSEQ